MIAPAPRTIASRFALASASHFTIASASRFALARASLLALALASLLTLGACAPREVRPPPGALAVTCDDPNALVWVDDALVGRAADLAARPAPLRPGLRRVEVHAEGKLTAYREVDLRPGERASIAVTLRPDLDARDSP